MFKMFRLDRLTVRQRLISLAAAAVLTAVIIAGVGFVANSYSSDIAQRESTLVRMASNHKDVDTMHDSLRAYIVGQLLTMTFLGAITALGLYLLGVPYSLPFGILTGLVAIIPLRAMTADRV